MTIHGQIVDIPDLQSGGTITGKQFVYVYFHNTDTNYERPYLICLTDSTVNTKTWYERTGTASTGYTWNTTTDFDNENPDTISVGFENNLNGIKSNLGTDTGYTPLDSVEIDISTAPTQENAANGGKYMSGGITIEVTKQDVGTWKRYKHSNTDGFTLKKITHSDKDMTGTGQNALTGNMNKPIGSQGAIYVYYDAGGANLHQPKVICISTGNPEDPTKNTWYVAGANESSWVFQSNGINGKRKISEVTASNLTTATQNSRLTVEGSNYVIKLDKRPNTNNIRYRTKDKDVTVSQAPGTKVPSGYIAYEHQVSISGRNKIILQHNGNKLREVEVNQTQTVSKIFVYYKQPEDDKHEFPLIVCVKKSGGSPPQTYYKRGNEWKGDDQELNEIDPDNPGTTNLPKLRSKLEELKDKYDINIEHTKTDSGQNTYRASADGQEIIVAETTDTNKVPTGYIRYDHKPKNIATTPTFKLGLVRHNDILLNGIEYGQLVTAVYVYYHTSDNTEHQFPLIVCVKTNSGQTYYKRGNTWDGNDTTLNQIDPESPGTQLTTLGNKLGEVEGKFEVKLH